MKKIKRLKAILLILTICFTFIGCGNSKKESETTTKAMTTYSLDEIKLKLKGAWVVDMRGGNIYNFEEGFDTYTCINYGYNYSYTENGPCFLINGNVVTMTATVVMSNGERVKINANGTLDVYQDYVSITINDVHGFDDGIKYWKDMRLVYEYNDGDLTFTPNMVKVE